LDTTNSALKHVLLQMLSCISNPVLSLIFTIVFTLSLIWAVVLTLGTIRVLLKLSQRKINPQNEEGA